MMQRKFSRRDTQAIRDISRGLGTHVRQPETIPLDVLISRRAKLYRGVADWEAWRLVQRPDWR